MSYQLIYIELFLLVLLLIGASLIAFKEGHRRRVHLREMNDNILIGRDYDNVTKDCKTKKKDKL